MILHHLSLGIGILGVLVIVFGVAGGVARFLRTEVRSARGNNVEEDRKRLRHVLGYYLLLGMEFLIAADIIDTLMKPSVQDLIVLGAIVLIRAIISFSLNAELKVGRDTPCAPQPGENPKDAPGVSRPTSALAPALVGTSRCDVPARESAGGSVAPLHAARTAQRAVPTFSSP